MFDFPNLHKHFLIKKTLVNVGEDCPVFDGLFEFCQISSGGSLGINFFLFLKNKYY